MYLNNAISRYSVNSRTASYPMMSSITLEKEQEYEAAPHLVLCEGEKDLASGWRAFEVIPVGAEA